MSRRALVPLLLLALALPAIAGAANDEVSSPGRCDGAVRSQLTVTRDGSRLIVVFVIDMRKTGQRWRVVLRRNGNVFARTGVRTQGPQAIAKVRRRIRNRRGPDTIGARGVRADRTCKAAVTIE